MFLRPLGTALSYFFFKIAYFSRFRMISVGGRDMNSFSGMHERIRRCTKGSADAQKDPQMHKRIRRCTKGSAWHPPRLWPAWRGSGSISFTDQGWSISFMDLDPYDFRIRRELNQGFGAISFTDPQVAANPFIYIIGIYTIYSYT